MLVVPVGGTQDVEVLEGDQKILGIAHYCLRVG